MTEYVLIRNLPKLSLTLMIRVTQQGKNLHFKGFLQSQRCFLQADTSVYAWPVESLQQYELQLISLRHGGCQRISCYGSCLLQWLPFLPAFLLPFCMRLDTLGPLLYLQTMSEIFLHQPRSNGSFCSPSEVFFWTKVFKESSTTDVIWETSMYVLLPHV